jgi:hypothetical protein
MYVFRDIFGQVNDITGTYAAHRRMEKIIGICSLYITCCDFINLSTVLIQTMLKENSAMVLINHCHKPSESHSLMLLAVTSLETLTLKAKYEYIIISSDYCSSIIL